jgi:hypothetical protein
MDVFNLLDRAHSANPRLRSGRTISATRLTLRERQLGFRFLF